MKPFVALPNWQCMDGDFHQIEGYRKTYSSEYWLLIQPAAYQWQDNHAEEVECDKPTVPVEALRHSKEVLNKIFYAIFFQRITPPIIKIEGTVITKSISQKTLSSAQICLKL